METIINSVKVKLGIKVMESVESLIGCEVTARQESECHFTFVRGRFHTAEQDPWSTINFLIDDFSVPRGIPVCVTYWKVARPSE